ncbi:protein TIC 22-like, chloroplastic [Silene latifolia]|uniref:protein TIC 22-like, chloroplastic n=1 Tax=Silene latifolia TaxID=37657 RepID=UPI003D78790E
MNFQQLIPNSPSILHKFFNSVTTHLNSHLPNFSSTISTPPFATIPQLTHQNPSLKTTRNDRGGVGVAMSNDDIEERLAGVPVYALSNSNEEFVLVSGIKSKMSIGLFCFKKEDADSLLNQMKLIDPNMRRGSSVVPVALNKVFQLKVNGVAFRLIPDASQIKNALKEKEKAGTPEDKILGVPVFQSRSLTLKADNRTYCPVFFRKEDLEKSLFRASKNQRKLNPVFRQGDIEVAVLEDIVKGMKDESSTKWNNVVFIPPGFDVSTDLSANKESAVQ